MKAYNKKRKPKHFTKACYKIVLYRGLYFFTRNTKRFSVVSLCGINICLKSYFKNTVKWFT